MTASQANDTPGAALGHAPDPRLINVLPATALADIITACGPPLINVLPTTGGLNHIDASLPSLPAVMRWNDVFEFAECADPSSLGHQLRIFLLYLVRCE